MANYQPVQDAFGLGRLSQEIRANRQEAQQAPIREAQTELLQGQVQQQRQGLADLARERQDDLDLRNTIESTPDQDATRTTLDFYKKRNPQKAQELTKNIYSQAANILKFNPQAATDMINSKTGSDFEYKGSGEGFHQVGSASAGKIFILNDAGETIRELEFEGGTGAAKVGAQEILEDGTIIQSTSAGPVVWGPQGNKLQGEEAATAIKVARSEKVSNERKKAGAKKRATLEEELALKGQVEKNIITQKEAAKISVKAFERIEGINLGIANLDEAINLVNSGVATGPIIKRFPSLKTNAVKLDNLQGRLGLDIIQNTTFGALSEAELKFALDTALPTGLVGQELVDWLQRKKSTQERLADYLESSAIFLEQPGNTVGKWFEKKRAKTQPIQQAQPAAQAGQAQEINFDAQGNII